MDADDNFNGLDSLLSPDETNSTYSPVPSEDLKRRYCRACGKISPSLTDIFGKRGIKMQLPKKLRHLCKISRDDSLPTRLCQSCLKQLEDSYSYLIKIQKSEQKLKNLFRTAIEDYSPENNNEKLENFDSETEESQFQDDPGILNIYYNEDIEEFDPLDNAESSLDANEGNPEFDIDDMESFQFVFQKHIEKNTDRLKEILDFDETNDFDSFVDYLEQRQILVSRMEDKDIKFCFNSFKNIQFHEKPRTDIFECDFCLSTFSDERVRKVHLQTHDDKIPFQCKDCLETFETLSQRRKHTPCCALKLKCRYCLQTFSDNYTKKNHEYVHYQEEPKLCSICGDLSTNLMNLKNHIRTCHSKLPRLRRSTVRSEVRCSKCSKIFQNQTNLTKHQSGPCKSQNYSCNICDATFAKFELLKKHVPSHVNKEGNVIIEEKCEMCQENFDNRSCLIAHIRNKHEIYCCDLCGASKKTYESLEKHMQLMHQQNIPSDSKVKSYHEKFALIKGNLTKGLSCLHCDKICTSERTMERHVRKEHLKDGPLKCFPCDETFESDIKLRIHLNRVHKNMDIAVECPDCEKTYVSPEKLRTHMLSHLNEAFFTCEFCSKTFLKKFNLRQHIKSVHLTDRPHGCSYCSAKFKQPGHLFRHEKLHNAEKKYNCGYCKETFLNIQDRKKHEKQHGFFDFSKYRVEGQSC